ncbi:MAG: hypothetical protein NZ874_06205 [Fimbriimonadales bacterium]|nr:hypothetical protein [Fimbriimonadales bacterium]
MTFETLKCLQLEIVSFLQGRLRTCPYPQRPVGARPRRAQKQDNSTCEAPTNQRNKRRDAVGETLTLRIRLCRVSIPLTNGVI